MNTKSRDPERNEMKSKGWWLYIILCENKSYYIGITPDIEARFKLHQEGRAAKHTRDYPPIVIVYRKQFESKSLARRRELQIKKWSRKKKERLIAGDYI